MLQPLKCAKINWNEPLPSVDAAHIFIDGNQLIKRWQGLADDAVFVIAELGFGCGLNFIHSVSLWKAHAPPSATLHFISAEKHPWTQADVSRLLASYPDLDPLQHALLKAYPPLIPGVHLLEFNHGRINLTLMLGDPLIAYEALLVSGDPVLEKTLLAYTIDAWYLNVFKPCARLLSTISLLSKPMTTLVSSVTSEPVQQDLIASGFDLQVSHTSFVSFIASPREPKPSSLFKRHTPWHVANPKTPESKRALVLGAGLAGCYTAYAMARRGWSVTLLDSAQALSTGASGNQHAVLYPKLSPFHSPLNDLMRTAYLYAIRTYPAFMKESSLGEFLGILQLAHHPKEAHAQEKLGQWLVDYPMLGRLVNAAEASALAGIVLQSGGLFLGQAGWIDIRMLCQLLVQPGIQWIPNTLVTSLDYEAGEWHVNEHHAKVLVLANGHHAASFHQTAHLPLDAVRGQMSSKKCDRYSENLRMPLCAEGHVLPAVDGHHTFGATYHRLDATKGCHRIDDQMNLDKLELIAKEFTSSKTITGHWSGIRATTPDYLPLVGPVAKVHAFQTAFKGLATDANRWIPSAGTYHEGLYVISGFGSRGLTTIPLCAEWLARTLNQEPTGLSRAMVQSFSPARFLRRDIIRAQGELLS